MFCITVNSRFFFLKYFFQGNRRWCGRHMVVMWPTCVNDIPNHSTIYKTLWAINCTISISEDQIWVITSRTELSLNLACQKLAILGPNLRCLLRKIGDEGMTPGAPSPRARARLSFLRLRDVRVGPAHMVLLLYFFFAFFCFSYFLFWHLNNFIFRNLFRFRIWTNFYFEQI
jgi:hypothetical protein